VAYFCHIALGGSGALVGAVHRGNVVTMVVCVVNELHRQPSDDGVTANRQATRQSVNPSASNRSFHGRDCAMDWRISANVAPVTE
jgi:hypothetical protein